MRGRDETMFLVKAPLTFYRAETRLLSRPLTSSLRRTPGSIVPPARQRRYGSRLSPGRRKKGLGFWQTAPNSADPGLHLELRLGLGLDLLEADARRDLDEGHAALVDRKDAELGDHQ